jgi:hypothetical protein
MVFYNAIYIAQFITQVIYFNNSTGKVMEKLNILLMIEGLILFLLDIYMTILFCTITFEYLNVLPCGFFTRTARKVAVKIITITFTIRAVSADLLNSGPSFMYLMMK